MDKSADLQNDQIDEKRTTKQIDDSKNIKIERHNPVIYFLSSAPRTAGMLYYLSSNLFRSFCGSTYVQTHDDSPHRDEH
jgi:hypothetical protein